MFALVDCDNFYCSCERVFRPELNKRPVLVLSNNDGCAIARSSEVKALGIKMGDPYFKLKNLINKHKIVVFSSNYELYGNMSERVISTLRTFSKDIEVYSIDEAFIHINDNFTDEDSSELISKVQHWTGIPVKAGIAKTKTLCKVAAELVKKRNIVSKYCFLIEPTQIENELATFNISDIWGIGRKTAEKLYCIGVKTALQLRNLPEEYIKKRYGINLLRTALELKEIQCYSLETYPQSKNSTCYSRSFSKPITTFKEMKQSIVFYATGVSHNLRKGKQLASAVTVYITTNYYNKTDLQYSNSYTIPLIEQSSSTFDIVNTACECLRKIFIKGYRYKKSGVILSDLVDEKMSQGNLFSDKNIQNDKVSATMDLINNKFGSGTIKLAGEGLSQQGWKMKRGKLSPRYTTIWDELLEID